MRPVWLRLEVKTYKREELARLTGIPATNLSSLNTGEMPMTMALATRIAKAVPGVSLLDLGAPEEAVDEMEARSLAHRIEEVADLVGRGFLALGVTQDQLRPPAEEPGRTEKR